jgi:type IX secretion system PorP/SprF family membrane protein
MAVLFALAGRGQDIHFSQFNGSLLNLSPGFTGLFNGDYRFGAIYRSQWQSVPVNYSTFGMQAERRLRPRRLEKDMVGVGIQFNNDRAGDARYGTTQLYLSGSYIFMANEDSSLFITLGANMGWSQVGFDYSRMTFDNQFDGSQYNRLLPTGEQFGFVRSNFFDMNAGSVVRYIHNKKYTYTYGLGVHHVTRPVISYQGNDVSKLDLKLNNYLSFRFPLKYSTDIITEALLTNQGKNYEIIPHASVVYFTKKPENESVSAGVAFRARDAVVARLGYTRRTLQSGISYDINTSSFTPATNRRGGFEIFLLYVLRVKPGFTAAKRNCPVFL